MKSSIKHIIAAGLLTISTGAFADAIVTATGDGWCADTYGCNNTNVNTYANIFAGDLGVGGIFHNWFAFNVPTGNISSATLSIWNEASNYNYNPSAVYNVHSTSAISFDGLVSGSVLGSITVGAATNGTSHFVDINLNSTGIAYLNASQGQQIVLGGGVTGSNVQLFGYTGGLPTATLAVTSAVPEPETYAMMLAGLGMLGFLARRKNAQKLDA